MPADYAQIVAERMIAAGIFGIWNFAPVKLRVPKDICIINEDLSVGLSSISYYLTKRLSENN